MDTKSVQKKQKFKIKNGAIWRISDTEEEIMMPCPKCQDERYVYYSNGPDDYTKELCDYCQEEI